MRFPLNLHFRMTGSSRETSRGHRVKRNGMTIQLGLASDPLGLDTMQDCCTIEKDKERGKQRPDIITIDKATLIVTMLIVGIGLKCK